MNDLYQITAPYFCAGIDFKGTLIVKEAAPIIKYMKGWTLQKVSNYCLCKRWTLKQINTLQ